MQFNKKQPLHYSLDKKVAKEKRFTSSNPANIKQY